MKKITTIVLALVMILSALPVCVSAATLKEGSIGTDVRYLKMNLQALGYFDGTPDKVFDKATTDAVKHYQRDHGLDDDGKVGKYTTASIEEEITAIQTALAQAGYEVGDIDGVAGTKFWKAIRSLRRDYLLKDTGYCDSAVLSTLAGIRAEALKDATYPTNLDDAEDMLILSSKVKDVKTGRIRYVAQVKGDDYYSDKYFTYDGGTINSSDKCTRCSLSMALSFLGVDLTPGDMTDLTGQVDIPSPIRDVPKYLPEVEKVNSGDFEKLFENYNDDPDNYTPVVCYFNYKNKSSQHAVVIYGFDGYYYYAADPAANKSHIIRLRINSDFTKIIESPDYTKYESNSSMRSFTQWRLAD